MALNSPWPASIQFRFSLMSWSYKHLGALPVAISQESNGWGIWIPSLWFSAYLESSTSSFKETTEAKKDLLSTFLWAWFSPKAQPYCDGDRKQSSSDVAKKKKQDWHIQLLHNLTYNFNFKLYKGLLHNMDQRTLLSLTHYHSVWPLGTGYTEGSRKTPWAKHIKKNTKQN